MLVVLAIIVVITGVVINGQSTYNRSLLLTDTAYTVAYSVRQAQSLGLASRGINSVSDAGYGVHFEGTIGYIVYADTKAPQIPLDEAVCPRGVSGTPESRPGNCRYDSASPNNDAIVQNYTFSRGFAISGICGKTGGGSPCTQITSLDVVFMRPETRAIMTGPSPSYQSYTCAEVLIAPPTGTPTRMVRISQLGEISVGQACP